MSWAIAQKVCHPLEHWTTKDVNAFKFENLTLVPNKKKQLESDKHQDKFQKEI